MEEGARLRLGGRCPRARSGPHRRSRALSLSPSLFASAYNAPRRRSPHLRRRSAGRRSLIWPPIIENCRKRNGGAPTRIPRARGLPRKSVCAPARRANPSIGLIYTMRHAFAGLACLFQPRAAAPGTANKPRAGRWPSGRRGCRRILRPTVSLLLIRERFRSGRAGGPLRTSSKLYRFLILTDLFGNFQYVVVFGRSNENRCCIEIRILKMTYFTLPHKLLLSGDISACILRFL